MPILGFPQSHFAGCSRTTCTTFHSRNWPAVDTPSSLVTRMFAGGTTTASTGAGSAGWKVAFRTALAADTGIASRMNRCASSQHVMSLEILQQATSLTRLAHILDECTVSASDPQVAAIAVHKLAVMGVDVASGNVEAFRLLQMDQKAITLCAAAADVAELHNGQTNMSLHDMADALTGLSELSRVHDRLCDHSAVQEYASALAAFGLSNWDQWPETKHVRTIEELACLLDSLAFLSPVNTPAYDALAVKIVHDLLTCTQALREHHTISSGEIRGLCGGVWALAAYFGTRDRQLYPRLTVACAAEIMQLDHPNNIVAGCCQYTPQGTALLVKAASNTASPKQVVVDCMDTICQVIRGRVLRNQQAVRCLQAGDFIVRLLTGIVEAGCTTSKTEACARALLRLCTHEMQCQAREGSFYPACPILPARNTAVVAAAITHLDIAITTAKETLLLSMHLMAIPLAGSPPGSLKREVIDHAIIGLPTGQSDGDIDLVSQVSLLKSVIRMDILPPAVTLLALEPHWVAVGAEACNPCEVQALAELPETLMHGRYTPGPALVSTLCSAIVRSNSAMHVKARQILCVTCQAPVAAHSCIREHLEEIIMQLGDQGCKSMPDNPTLAWTLMALLDAAIMVHSHLWDQLHHMALDLVEQNRNETSDLLHILRFSHCVHSSLACRVTVGAGDDRIPPPDREFNGCFLDQKLCPALLQFPVAQDFAGEANMMRGHLFNAYAAEDTNLCLDSFWQDLVMLDNAESSIADPRPV